MSDIRTRKNSKYYHYDIMIDGIRYRGSCQTDDKNLAEKVASTIKSDIIRQKHDLPTKIDYNDYIFQDIWKSYISTQSLCFKTQESKLNSAKHFLPVFENKSIKNITQDLIEAYQLKRKSEIAEKSEKRLQDISFRTVNIEMSELSYFFNYCIKKGYIKTNPAAKIKKLNELSRIKTLSDGDIDKLITGATNKLTRDLITFLIYTGCRKGEALNLKWDDIETNIGIIAIKGTKTKYDRHIPISKPLKKLLSDVEKKDGCEYVFNDNGKKLGDFKRSFHTACRNAGLKDMHIHDLRHVFASKMVMGGTSLYITGELLGHKTPQMTMRYAHLMPDGLKKAMDDVFGKNHFEKKQAEQFKKAMEIIKEKKNDI